MKRWLCVAVFLSLLESARAATASDLTAKEIYDGACASCHGVDGRGANDSAVSVPLPDFTDCAFVTTENDGNWGHLLTHGGPDLALSAEMPAFGDVLTTEQIRAVLDYTRAFCTDARWPHGDLNFRRSLVTAKAFPEDEALLLPEFTKGRAGERAWTTELSVEHRVGPRGEIEVSLPLAAHAVTGGATTGGIGDIALSYKHVLYADRPSLTILAAGLELAFPSGDQNRGLGEGTVGIGPSLLAGRQLGPLTLQGQIRGDVPIDERRADRALHYRLAFGYPFSILKRDWVPAVELEVLQNVTAKQDNVFITPQIYKGLSKRGHIAVAVGAQIPVAGDTDPLAVRVLTFFLWEYNDGPLW